MIIFRHPSEYILIGKIGTDYGNLLHGFKNLKRLCPEQDIPEGYEQVTEIRGQKVYKENGRLIDKLWALERFKA